MDRYLEIAKAAADLGSTGLMILVVGWLVNKWAGKFLAAQEAQARAVADLAEAVKAGQGEQREVLLAVRVMATKLDELRETIKEHVTEGALR